MLSHGPATPIPPRPKAAAAAAAFENLSAGSRLCACVPHPRRRPDTPVLAAPAKRVIAVASRRGRASRGWATRQFLPSANSR